MFDYDLWRFPINVFLVTGSFFFIPVSFKPSAHVEGMCLAIFSKIIMAVCTRCFTDIVQPMAYFLVLLLFGKTDAKSFVRGKLCWIKKLDAVALAVWACFFSWANSYLKWKVQVSKLFWSPSILQWTLTFVWQHDYIGEIFNKECNKTWKDDF